MVNNVKHFRNIRKLSQKELSERVGISRPYLSKIETGKAMPTMPIALKISNALKKDVKTIFFDQNVHHSVQKDNNSV